MSWQKKNVSEIPFCSGERYIYGPVEKKSGLNGLITIPAYFKISCNSLYPFLIKRCVEHLLAHIHFLFPSPEH